MKSRAFTTFSSCLFLILISCSPDPSETKSDVIKSDTAQTDFMKSASRDPKNYVDDCRDLFQAARKADSTLITQTEINLASAKAAIKAFTDFAYYCQNDSLAPVFLIKTAQVARSIDQIQKAKEVLDKCIADHKNFRNMPAALFLLAQLYDEQSYLNNEAEAKRLYEQIVTEYPKSDWAVSAKGALQFIGKSDEELLKEFKKKNAQ